MGKKGKNEEIYDAIVIFKEDKNKVIAEVIMWIGYVSLHSWVILLKNYIVTILIEQYSSEYCDDFYIFTIE